MKEEKRSIPCIEKAAQLAEKLNAIKPQDRDTVTLLASAFAAGYQTGYQRASEKHQRRETTWQ